MPEEVATSESRIDLPVSGMSCALVQPACRSLSGPA
jgi:hypothetical protein